MVGEPDTMKGFLHYVGFGFFGALTALLIAQLFPSIIPAQATGVKL
jgi:hypothetical protein